MTNFFGSGEETLTTTSPFFGTNENLNEKTPSIFGGSSEIGGGNDKISSSIFGGGVNFFGGDDSTPSIFGSNGTEETSTNTTTTPFFGSNDYKTEEKPNTTTTPFFGSNGNEESSTSTNTTPFFGSDTTQNNTLFGNLSNEKDFMNLFKVDTQEQGQKDKNMSDIFFSGVTEPVGGKDNNNNQSFNFFDNIKKDSSDTPPSTNFNMFFGSTEEKTNPETTKTVGQETPFSFF